MAYAAWTYVSVPAWNERILEEVGAFAQGKTDNKIEQYIYATLRKKIGMGKTNSVGSGTGALNSDLTAKGTVTVCFSASSSENAETCSAVTQPLQITFTNVSSHSHRICDCVQLMLFVPVLQVAFSCLVMSKLPTASVR